MLGHPVKQCGDIARHARRDREHGRIDGGLLVDHKQPRVGASPVLRKDSAIDRGREYDATPFLETDEGVDPRWIVMGEGGAGDGDETPAVAKAR